MEIRFAKAAGKHVGRAAARYVMANAAPRPTRTKTGVDAWLYVGRDEQGRELEVIAVEVENWAKHDPYLLVIHAMPTQTGQRR